MGVAEAISRRYYLNDQGTAHKAIIYISNDGQSFKTIHIGEALGKYFGNAKASTQIDKILCTHQNDEAADDLLSSVWKIPELPPSWEEQRGLESVSRTSTGSASPPGRENDDPPLGRVVTSLKNDSNAQTSLTGDVDFDSQAVARTPQPIIQQSTGSLMNPPTWRQTSTVSSFYDIEWTGTTNAADSFGSAADIRSLPASTMLLRSRSPGTCSPEIHDVVFEDRVPSNVMTTDYRPNEQAIDIAALNAKMDQFFESILPEELASRLPASRPSAATSLRRFDRQASPVQPQQGATESDVQEEASAEEPAASVDIRRDRVFSTLHPSSSPQRSQTESPAALLIEHDSDTGESDSEESDSEVGIAVTSTEAGSTEFTAAGRHIEDVLPMSTPPEGSRLRSRSRDLHTPEYRSSRADRGYTHEIGYAGERWVSLDLPLTV
jgi:hypothetical protein